MKKILMSVAAFCALIAAPSLAEAAVRGFSTANVNMRSGPSTGYPAVTVIPVGTPVTIYGCMSSVNWCDVEFFGGRGWVSGNYVQASYQSNRVYVAPDYYPRLGIPIITFDVDTYWGRYYRNRDFYRERDRWRRFTWDGNDRRPPPPPRWEPPRVDRDPPRWDRDRDRWDRDRDRDRGQWDRDRNRDRDRWERDRDRDRDRDRGERPSPPRVDRDNDRRPPPPRVDRDDDRRPPPPRVDRDNDRRPPPPRVERNDDRRPPRVERDRNDEIRVRRRDDGGSNDIRRLGGDRREPSGQNCAPGSPGCSPRQRD